MEEDAEAKRLGAFVGRLTYVFRGFYIWNFLRQHEDFLKGLDADKTKEVVLKAIIRDVLIDTAALFDPVIDLHRNKNHSIEVYRRKEDFENADSIMKLRKIRSKLLAHLDTAYIESESMDSFLQDLGFTVEQFEEILKEIVGLLSEKAEQIGIDHFVDKLLLEAVKLEAEVQTRRLFNIQ